MEIAMLMIGLLLGGCVSFCILGCIHLKLCADLRRFDFGSAVVAVLDDGNLALDNILIGVEGLGNVVFYGIEFGLSADVQALGID